MYYDEFIKIKNNYNEALSEKDKKISTVTILDETVQVLKNIKMKKISAKKPFLVSMINKALSNIFYDKNITVDIKTSETDTGNFKYEIEIYKNGILLSSNSEIYSTTGGGVISVIAWILKFTMNYVYNTGDLIIFDEMFAQVSEKYVPRISLFIRDICEKYKINMLFISHQNLDEFAHIKYQLSGYKENEIDTLRIDNEIDDNKYKHSYYEVKIKNFQSILDNTFKIKGFTCIKGDSDIGKSAITRAINSILSNNFSASYKRIKTRKPTEIIFTKINKDDKKSIKLEYKSGVVHFILDNGEVLKGKSLAAERLKNELTSFGFNKIDLDSYSNWNSELKKQTENSIITSQHDKLYFSNERNSTERILSIIFKSQVIDNAILTASKDLRKEKEDLDIFIKTEFKLIEEKYNTAKIEYAKVQITRLVEYSDELNKISEKIDKLKIVNDKTSNLIQIKNDIKIVNILKLATNINLEIENYKYKLNDFQNKIDNYISCKTNIKLVTDLNKLSQLINDANQLESKYTDMSDNIKHFKKLSNYIDAIIDLEKIYKYNLTLYDYNRQYGEIITNINKQYEIKNILNLQINLTKLMNYQSELKESVNKVKLLNNKIISISRISKHIITLIKLKQFVAANKQIIKDNLQLKSNLLKQYIQAKNKNSILEQIMNSKIIKIDNFKQENNITICPACNGLGYIHNHKGE